VGLGLLLLAGIAIVAGANIDASWAYPWVLGMVAVGLWLIIQSGSRFAALGSIAVGAVTLSVSGWSMVTTGRYDQSLNVITVTIAALAVSLTLGGVLRRRGQ